MNKKYFFLIVVLFFLTTSNNYATSQITLHNTLFLTGISQSASVKVPDSLKLKYVKLKYSENGTTNTIQDSIQLSSLAGYDLCFNRTGTYQISINNMQDEILAEKEIRVIPGWFSLIPPFLAILLAPPLLIWRDRGR